PLFQQPLLSLALARQRARRRLPRAAAPRRMSFSARDELLRRALPGHVYSAGAESPTGPARSPGSRGGSRGGNGFVRSGADWVQSDIPLRVEVLEHLFEESIVQQLQLHRAASS
ncbi:unnamed protein product, partial [Prorocentrum cordatum]